MVAILRPPIVGRGIRDSAAKTPGSAGHVQTAAGGGEETEEETEPET